MTRLSYKIWNEFTQYSQLTSPNKDETVLVIWASLTPSSGWKLGKSLNLIVFKFAGTQGEETIKKQNGEIERCKKLS